MPNLASLLKSEILRLARKEVRTELESLRKTSARYRSEIAELKRRLDQLERQQQRTAKKSSGIPVESVSQEVTTRLRFSAKRFAQQREKLGLPATSMGKLLGVSGQTIYHWEAGKSRPRPAQLEAIAALRKLGKREVKRRLDAEALRPNQES